MFDAAGAATGAEAVHDTLTPDAADTSDATPADAALAHAAADHDAPPESTPDHAAPDNPVDADDTPEAVPLAVAPEAPRKEVAVIDTSLAGWQDLRDSVAAGTEILLIQPGTDGLAQLAAWAEDKQDYDAIHILGHGGAGYVYLGGAVLDAATAEARATELAAIGQALGVGGDLMLYGCNAADGLGGAALMEALSRLTGADVAASEDITGAASLGGNWTLEQRTGSIETQAIQAEGYAGTLTTPATLTTFSGANFPYLARYVPGFTPGTVATATDVYGTGWDISVTTMVNNVVLGIKGNLAEGDTDKRSITVFGADSTTTFTANNPTAVFNLESFGVYLKENAVMHVQAVGADGSLIGTAVDTAVTAMTFTLATPMGANPDFQGIHGFQVTFTSSANYNYVAPVFDSISISNIGVANQPPTAADNTVTVTEDGTHTFTAAEFGYADAEGAPMASIRIASVPGGGTLWLDSNGDGLANEGALAVGAVVSKADIDANRLKFSPAADSTASQSFTFTVNDGTKDSTTARTMTLDVTPVNDAPVNTVPGGQTMVENAAHTFSAANGNALTVGDVDAGATLTTTLSVPSGTLQVSTGGSAVISANGTGSVTISGSAAEVNAALASVTFLPATDMSGSVTLTMHTSDGTLSDSDTVGITVTALNRLPAAGGNVTVTAPDGSAAVVREDSTPTAANIRLTPATLSDPNGSTPSHIRILSVTGGTLLQANGSSLTLGAAGTAMSLTAGGLALRFIPDADRDTPGSIVYVVVDPDDTTLNGPASTALVPIVPVVETPSITNAATAEDTLSSGGLVVTPGPDTVPASHYKITGITGGTLYLSDGTTVVSEGSFVTAAAATAGFRFLPSPNSTASGSFQVQASSSASDAGLGGTAVTASIAVSAVNDAPTVTAPASIAVTEDADSVVKTITFSDVDAATGSVTVTVSVPKGSLAATSGAGVVVGGTAQALTLTGTIADIHAFLQSDRLTYRTAANDTAGTMMDVSITDNGNTGSGGALTGSASIALSVIPTNDAPTAVSALPAQAAIRGQAFTATVPAGAFTDIDGDSLTWSATLADGSPLPSWLSFNAATRTLSGTPPAGGVMGVKITVTDAAGASASQSFTLTVAAATVPGGVTVPTSPGTGTGGTDPATANPAATPSAGDPPSAGEPGTVKRSVVFGAAAPNVGANPFSNAQAPDGTGRAGNAAGAPVSQGPQAPVDGGTPVRAAALAEAAKGTSETGVRATVTGRLGSPSPISNSGTPVTTAVENFDTLTRRSLSDTAGSVRTGADSGRPGDAGRSGTGRIGANGDGGRVLPASTLRFGGSLAGAVEDAPAPEGEAPGRTPEEEEKPVEPIAAAPPFTGSVRKEHTRFDSEVAVVVKAVAAVARGVPQHAV